MDLLYYAMINHRQRLLKLVVVDRRVRNIYLLDVM